MKFGKRAFDIVAILISGLIVLPIIMILALLVARDGHNPFYAQKRVGRNGRLFNMWKLRSMVPDAQNMLEPYLAANPEARAEWNASQKLKDDPRITRTGRILRKTSLDELPQLFNVLKGDMSLVGPRPMMACQQPLYYGTAYYSLQPGMTGLWQISDRNNCDFKDRVIFDETYGADVSLKKDMAILAKTVGVVYTGTGC